MSYEYPPTSAPTQPPNSTLAIVSLVAGILGLTVFPTIGSIVAIITGYMAKNEIRDSGGAIGGGGLATAGLIMGWIGVALGLIGICIACVMFALIPLMAVSTGDYWILPALFSALF
jgi:hypothetical protein